MHHVSQYTECMHALSLIPAHEKMLNISYTVVVSFTQIPLQSGLKSLVQEQQTLVCQFFYVKSDVVATKRIS